MIWGLLLDGEGRVMGYRVRVERDSIGPTGKHRLASILVTYPRVVLAEAVTHRNNMDCWGDEFYTYERAATRDISKNSASSRAIPFNRMLTKVWEDPYIPEWTLNQKGMQGGYVEDGKIKEEATSAWLRGRNRAVATATELDKLGIHKQDLNRCLEPYLWITQLVTSSRWDNFFGLRCHSAAHPALRKIARLMYVALQKSAPEGLEEGQWHLPFVPLEEQRKFLWEPWEPSGVMPENFEIPDLIKFSAARTGWLSYENHDKDGSPEQMRSTFARFFPTDGSPVHGSPLECQATPFDEKEWRDAVRNKYRSNLTGWLQARKLISTEEIKEYKPSQEEVDSWKVDESLIEVK